MNNETKNMVRSIEILTVQHNKVGKSTSLYKMVRLSGVLHSLCNTGNDLRLLMKRSANGQKSFSYRGAKLWNRLSAESSKQPLCTVLRKLLRYKNFFLSVLL